MRWEDAAAVGASCAARSRAGPIPREARLVRQEAERLMERVFSHKHRKPTYKQISDAIEQNPRILEIARETLREREAALRFVKIDIDL